jgi:hypothetical protein
MSPTTDQEQQTAMLDQPDVPEPSMADLYALAFDTNNKVTEIRDILRDLSAKVEAGAAAIPEIADKLGNVPIIGGAIRALLNPTD